MKLVNILKLPTSSFWIKPKAWMESSEWLYIDTSLRYAKFGQRIKKLPFWEIQGTFTFLKKLLLILELIIMFFGSLLTIIGVGFEVGEGGSQNYPNLSKSRYKYAKNLRFVVLENVPFSTKNLLILLMSAFLAKKQTFLAKIVSLLEAIAW